MGNQQHQLENEERQREKEGGWQGENQTKDNT